MSLSKQMKTLFLLSLSLTLSGSHKASLQQQQPASQDLRHTEHESSGQNVEYSCIPHLTRLRSWGMQGQVFVQVRFEQECLLTLGALVADGSVWVHVAHVVT